MPTLAVKMRDGRVRELVALSGSTVMEALRGAGIDELLSLCGGSCSCATCHVYLDGETGSVGAVSADEDDLLDSSEHRRHTSRLSCQVRIKPDFVAPMSRLPRKI